MFGVEFVRSCTWVAVGGEDAGDRFVYVIVGFGGAGEVFGGVLFDVAFSLRGSFEGCEGVGTEIAMREEDAVFVIATNT